MGCGRLEEVVVGVEQRSFSEGLGLGLVLAKNKGIVDGLWMVLQCRVA